MANNFKGLFQNPIAAWGPGPCLFDIVMLLARAGGPCYGSGKVPKLLQDSFLLTCLVVLLSVNQGFAQKASQPTTSLNEPHVCDPSKVIGSEACAKCHANEIAQWKRTPHFQTFDTLHRLPEAKAIVKKLGLRTVKRNDTCIKCHYTQQKMESRIRIVSGISCESCHGGAIKWKDIHADYGGPNATADAETPEHREQRRDASISAGMNNPANLYLIAKQCYSCHTVPDEKLVNVGGHRAGSAEFELVAWSQGMVRHNFLHGGNLSNAPSTPERLRVMYVVGVMTDLEQSLRATAQATEIATFGKTSASRAARMKHQLRKIQIRINDPHIEEALRAVATLKITLNNQEAILAAADKVGAAANQFSVEADGAELSDIESMLPHPSQYKN